MKQAWFTAAEIADLSGMTVQAVNQIAARQHWRSQSALARKRCGRGGGWEYHTSLLPGDVQAKITLQSENHADEVEEPEHSNWARYERLTKKQKQICKDRLDLLDQVDVLIRSGAGETAAVRMVAKRAGKAPSTIFNWRAQLRGVDRADRLAALAPGWKGSGTLSEVHREAWSAFKSDYLRAEAPGFSACYRRMKAAAAKQKWQPIPSERSLRRRLNAEVSHTAQTMARKGRETAKTLYPAQRRIRTHLHAMQAVNMDGHKLDVFCRLPDGSVTRMHLLAIQDLYSGKFVAWRLAEGENKESVRLVIGDMVERYGIPDQMVIDNGRAFSSKWISGGTPNRYRFKVRAEEPKGLLTTLGVEITFTTPYSGQSKPIERAFRDLTEEIAKHPVCAGAYTGNRPDAKPENYGNSAISLEDLRMHVDRQIMEHNARPGRRSEVAQGRSFDEAFTASLNAPSTVVRWPTEAQKSLWLLAAEEIRAQRGSGEIHFMENRYWSPALNAYAGKKLTVRFDPDHLLEGVQAYDAEDRLICHAACIADTGFNDVDAARKHAANRNAFLKLNREQERLHAELSAEELARLYRQDQPAKPKPQKPSVVRIAGGSAAKLVEPDDEPEWDEEAEDNFSRGVRLVASNTFED